MDQTKQTNTSIVIDAVIDMLVAKNPLFESQRDAYREKLTPQYETYLMTNLMGLLSDTQYDELEKLMTDFPMDKEKHTLYLKDTVADFEDVVVELARNFIASYGTMIDQM
jgi:hypothetical protein